MKYLSLILKGFIIGIAKIIPGVSGAVIAISFGIYEKLINIISRPLHIKFNDLKFLSFLFIGAALGIGVFCKIVKFCIDNCYLPTMLLFLGLIIGGTPNILNEIKNKRKFSNMFSFAICFTLFYLIINLQSGYYFNHNSFIYFIIGSIESLTTIIPGISGTAVFMALGLYNTLLTIFEEMSNFTIGLNTLILFLSGFIISTVLIAKIINYIFKHKREIAYCCVFGFMSSSLLVMLINSFTEPFTIIELLFGICLFIFGLFLTNKINSFFSKF